MLAGPVAAHIMRRTAVSGSVVGGTPLQKAALYAAGIFFAVGAVVLAIRLFTSFDIVVGNTIEPVWVSIPSLTAAILPAIWMAVAARRS